MKNAASAAGQFVQGFLYKMNRKKVTENRLWSCKAKEPTSGNGAFTIIQLFLFGTTEVAVGLFDLLQLPAATKRTSPA